MNSRDLDGEAIRIPRWTIWRDPEPLGCADCGSMIVWVQVDRQCLAFCECRMIESRRVRPNRRKAA